CGIFESDSVEVGLEKLRGTVVSLLGAEAHAVADHLAILLGLDAEGSVADRETLFFSVRGFIEAVASKQPTVLVFEDLHWADASLLDLVDMLAARLRDVPIFLLVLAALERRDLVRRERVSAIEGDEQYVFKHVLIRDVAYDLLPRARRQERHEQCARFLEEATAEIGEAGAALARHWRDAGDRVRALDYLVAAG